MRSYQFALMVLAGAVLAACGGSNGTAPAPPAELARGALEVNPPPQVLALTTVQLKTALDAAGMTPVTGVPKCTVTTYNMKYGTVGGAKEATDATGAIMVPSGADPACSGARPVLLYAHGTTIDKNYNMADLATNTEAALQAGLYAAQGFIVVAPNYAGYNGSKLSYHPYLDAEQSANDMVDGLRAARTAFSKIGTTASDKLFITGYSQGGHVAMATQRAMQQTYASEFTVTALAGQSGPYAMSLLGDIAFGGKPNVGATIFFPMISASWQKQSNGTLYSSPSDMYEVLYATGIDSLLPSATLNTYDKLFTAGKLPQTALFAAEDPQIHWLPGFGFGANNLIKSSFRTAYLADMMANPCVANPNPATCTPAHPFRKAGLKNDLRNYTPTVPVLLCGGKGDPTVFWASSEVTAGYFLDQGMPGGMLTLLDVASATTGDQFDDVKDGFAVLVAMTKAAAGGGLAGEQAVFTAYHGGLVPPFCGAAARGVFEALL